MDLGISSWIYTLLTLWSLAGYLASPRVILLIMKMSIASIPTSHAMERLKQNIVPKIRNIVVGLQKVGSYE